MASGMRSFQSTKITFFVFLDIITAVTGIFIFIVLLLSFRLNETGPNSQSDGTASNAPTAGNAALESRLADLLRQLEELVVANHAQQVALAEAETSPDLGALRADIAALQSAIARERAAGAQILAAEKGRSAADDARDNALGLTTDRAQVQQIKDHLAALAAEIAAKRQKSDSLENEVKQAEARLLDARARRGNRLWLVPDLPATSKEPVLLVVGGQESVAERFNKPASRVQLGSDDGAGAFRKLLGRCNKLNDYLVFYVRPSGVKRFEEYVEVARKAGFEVGYDAIEEDRQLVFSKPPQE